MKFGVVIFPGSNCDQDVIHVLREVIGCEVKELWHKDTDLHGLTTEDCIVLPGGFSYGDYLRSGAIARLSPVMKSVIDFANKGGKVLGICNGFQVLCESSLLPGALLKNKSQLFSCKNVFLKVESKASPMTAELEIGEIVKIPIAHSEGRYYADKSTLQEMESNNQILFRYCSEIGEVNMDFNPNGSVDNIAGICNKNGNVFAMMPHPERASESALGNTDGRKLFESIVEKIQVA